MRLFFAVELDRTTRALVARLAEELDIGEARVRWVAPENLHVTICFLGEVSVDDVNPLCRQVSSTVTALDPFEISLEGVGVFPPRGRPRVLWTGISSGCEELERTAAEVDRGLEQWGLPPENRRFTPHVTMGRIRAGRVRARELREASLPATAFSVSELILFRSELSPQGPRYTAVARMEFDAGR